LSGPVRIGPKFGTGEFERSNRVQTSLIVLILLIVPCFSDLHDIPLVSHEFNISLSEYKIGFNK